MDLSIFPRLIEEFIPFNKFLGMRAEHVERGRVRIALPYRDELIGDALRPALHGGVLSTLVDTVGGITLWTALENPSARVSTIDLRVDYLRPGKPELVVAEGVIVRVGRSVGVTDMRVFHPSAEDVTIATGKGVYSIKVPKHSMK
ncbi:MAG: hotdog fold thioesterase [Polyangiaceae bacterium]|nr:hotdog fold thioesterase [Polyangiaceae bacterium]NUQ72561.1 hotdog fold thioesterase [Polyangiaceae bacterium]